MTWKRLHLTLFATALCTASSAFAQQLPVHMVQKGETLASIAQRYYGEPRHEAALQQENGLSESAAKNLPPGMPLVVPTVFLYRVSSGESWKSIAQALYGSEDRAFVLLQANKGRARVQPDEGTQLLIPYPIRHVAKAGETVTQVARLYLSNSKEGARLIRRFNGLKSTRLDRGQLVLVPARSLRLSEEGEKLLQNAALRAGQGEVRSVQAEAAAKVPVLIDQVQRGAYAESVALGNQLLGRGGLTVTQEVTIHRELAAAYVALDRSDLAVASFQAALARQPNLELDTITTSPKVLAALAAARGK